MFLFRGHGRQASAETASANPATATTAPAPAAAAPTPAEMLGAHTSSFTLPGLSGLGRLSVVSSVCEPGSSVGVGNAAAGGSGGGEGPAAASPPPVSVPPDPSAAGCAEEDRYEFVRDINSGSFGTVQVARDRATGELVAIKLIPRGSRVTEQVVNEILNQRRLNHFHAVKLKRVILTQRYLGIVMEYCSGGDMYQFVLRTPRGLDEASARWFFQQMVIAVDYLHRLRVVHRDIKLRNMVLQEVGGRYLLKLCDFGFSKDANRQSLPKTRLGTLEYMAPELLRPRNSGSNTGGAGGGGTTAAGAAGQQGASAAAAAAGGAGAGADEQQQGQQWQAQQQQQQGQQGQGQGQGQQPYDGYDGEKIDVWSLGVALFFMLTRSYPYDMSEANANVAGREVAIMKSILEGPILIPSFASPECRDILALMLNKDPAQRIGMAGVIRHPFFIGNLPAGAAAMNDNPALYHAAPDLQTEVEIRMLCIEASRPLRQLKKLPSGLDHLQIAANDNVAAIMGPGYDPAAP